MSDAPPSESSSRAQALPLPTAGQLLVGRYTVLGELGKGGMGVVLAAYDSWLDRRVALKLLLPSTTGLDGELESLETRLLREAQAMARLSHPNVVAIYDSGTLEDGRLFLAMECVDGLNGHQWLKQCPRSWRDILRIYVEAGKGLSAAHEVGLVHRDFKPPNVLVGEDGRVRVTDFGLARPETFSASTSSWTSLSAQGVPQELWEAQLTLPGRIMGTARYLAPELLRGQPAHARSDLFAFCVALYEALYRQPAFGSNQGPAERRQAQEAGKVNPPPARSEVPRWVSRALLKGLQADVEARPASMAELVAALEADPAVRLRSRLRWAAVAVGVLALGGLAVADWARSQGPSCAQLAQGRLAGVWDGSMQAQVREALLGTGLAYAPDTSERVEAALAAYAGRWASLRAKACEEHQAPAQEARDLAVLKVYCLERRRSQLQALTQLLSRGPDKDLLPRALQGVQSLPGLEYCTDEEALTAAVPPPEDPPLRARVEALQVQVDRLEALYAAGKYREGVAQGERVLQETAAADWAPLHARALYWVAWLHFGADEGEKADSLARQALPLAARSKDDLLVAWTWNTLVWLKGVTLYHPNEALGLQLAVEAAAERADDDQARAESLQFLGVVLSESGRHEQARARIERALALNQKVLGPEHPYVANTLISLGVVLRRLGQYEQARVMLERSHATRESALGPEHPDVVNSHALLGQHLYRMGQYKQALTHYERALAIRERILGPEHPRVATSHTALANVLLSLGEYEQARMHQERALALEQKAQGTESPGLVYSLASLSHVLQSLEEYEQARQCLERALILWGKVPKSDYPTSQGILTRLGNVLRRSGRYEQARQYLEHTLSLLEQTPNSEPADLVAVHSGLGTLQREMGRSEQARAHLERALALKQQILGTESPHLALEHSGLGRTLVRLGDLEASGRHLEQALALSERAQGREPPQLVDALLGLGELHRAQGKPSQAVAFLERALSLAHGSTRAEVQLELAHALWDSAQDRPRALALATEARLASHRLRHLPRLAEASLWLAAHPGR